MITNQDIVKIAGKIAGVLIGLMAIVLFFFYYIFIAPPIFEIDSSSGNATFSREKFIVVDSGQGPTSVARELRALGIVKSDWFAEKLILNYLRRNGESIKIGYYVFEYPQNVFTVAKRLANADFGYAPVKVTIPEGANSDLLAKIFASKMPNINEETLAKLAQEKEGYLYPETYFFPPNVTTEKDIVDRLALAFEQTIAKPMDADIKDWSARTGRDLSDLMTMASILEEEVRTTEDKKIVADLLWRRIKEGMPLQVDATLAYVIHKTSAQMTLADLKKDNPYNTYTNKGLPPGPISNPSKDSILAAMNPTPNKYVFYLSDKDGITHFSKTLDEHNRLKNKYLR